MNSLVFKPTYEGLIKAKEKREQRWKDLDNNKYTNEEKIDRMLLDLEVYESMENVRKRASECLRKIVK